MSVLTFRKFRQTGPHDVSEWGKWANGPVRPKSLLPIGRKSYPLSKQFRWRMIRLIVDGRPHMLLLAHKMAGTPPMAEFRVMLIAAGDKSGGTVVCRVEFHGSHDGWHVHYQPHHPMQTDVVRPYGEAKKACPKGLLSDFQRSLDALENAFFEAVIDLFRLRR